jgi:hypothetical protein
MSDLVLSMMIFNNIRYEFKLISKPMDPTEPKLNQKKKNVDVEVYFSCALSKTG